MKITLVRHGQTENNYQELCQGRSNSLLNDTGRRQCQKLKDQIKDNHYDVCYMSPLVRAVETAMILIGDRVPMIRDDRLIERDLGELEGKPRSLYDSNKYWNYQLNCSDDGVEPIQDIFQRCGDFINYIFDKHKGESVMVVAHAAIVRAMGHILQKSDLTKNLVMKDIYNCYLEEIEVEDK